MAFEKKALSLEDTIKDNEMNLAVLQRQLSDAWDRLREQLRGSYKATSETQEAIIEGMAKKNREAYLEQGYAAKNLEDKVAMLTARVNQLRQENELAQEALAATKKEMDMQAKAAEYWSRSMDVVPRIFRQIKQYAQEADEKVGGLRKTVAGFLQTLSGGKKTDGNGGPANDTLAYWKTEMKTRQAELDRLRKDANATAAEVQKAKEGLDEAKKNIELFTGRKEYVKETREQDKEERDRLRKADEAARAETELRLADLTHRYAMGKMLYCDYVEEQERIQLEGIERRMLIYKEESLEYQKLSRQREELLLNGSEESRKLSLAQMKQGHKQRLAAIEAQAWRENMTEQQKNEMVFREDMRFLDEQRILYRQGTLERINLEREIEETDQQYRLQREQYYQQQLEQVREQLLGLSNERLMQLELNNINAVYDELCRQGVAREEQRQEAILAIQAKYAGYKATSERNKQKGSQMLEVASDAASQQLDGKQGSDMPFIGTIQTYQTTMAKLKELYGSDEKNHAAYLAAKQQATAQFCQELAAQMQAAYNTVNQVMSAASSYFTAQQEYETAQVQRKYEKQIDAAGNNQKKVKKLQEKQAKEEAAIKTKYAKRAAAIQMAQAVATTAMNAIQAYGAVLQPANPASYLYASIASAAAIAAGLLQIATIKKQQQTQEAGYYEGGFTGGKRYRREAGVVHEGEFVANHQAVNNPNVLPFLNFLDKAQRNNTVGSLTAADVSRSIGTGGSTLVAPVVNVQTDNEELKSAIELHREATNLLLLRLKDPIDAKVVLTGSDGLNEQQERLNKMLKNK